LVSSRSARSRSAWGRAARRHGGRRELRERRETENESHLRVRVDDPELDATDVAADHAVHGVGTATADADNLGRGGNVKGAIVRSCSRREEGVPRAREATRLGRKSGRFRGGKMILVI